MNITIITERDGESVGQNEIKTNDHLQIYLCVNYKKWYTTYSIYCVCRTEVFSSKNKSFR